MLKQIDNMLNAIIKTTVALLLIGIVVILSLNVFLRYVMRSPIFWSEEITVLGMIWFTFLAGALLVRDDKNIAIANIVDLLPRNIAAVVNVISNCLVLLIIVVMLWQSILLTERLGLSMTPALQIKESVYGAAMVAGFGGMLLFFLRNLIGKLITTIDNAKKLGDRK